MAAMDFKTCVVCNEEKTPKMLPCGHTFCVDCIDKLAQNERQHRPHCDTVKCPLCVQLTDFPPSGAKDLPTNYALLGVRDTFSEHLCQSCRRHIPEKHCKNCARDLCTPCGDNHTKQPLFQQHKLVALVELKCTAHGEHPRYYCSQCKTILCIRCIEEKSCSHTYEVKCIEEAPLCIQKDLADIKRQITAHINHNKKTIRPYKTSLSDTLELLTNTKNEIITHTETCLLKIKKEKDEMIKELDEIQKKVEREQQRLGRKDDCEILEGLLRTLRTADHKGKISLKVQFPVHLSLH